MKLVKTKEKGLKENYLELHYDEVDDETKELVSRLDTSLSNITGSCDGKQVAVPVTEVLYFDTVDIKTFAYTEKMCIEMRNTLKNVLDSKNESGETIKLDFIYGATHSGVMTPLDGQQRLTTLWLLHWFVAFFHYHHY